MADARDARPGGLVRRVVSRLQDTFRRPAASSAEYWERRYRACGTSGAGSEGALAAFKAEVLNGLVAEHEIQSVLELGCGDGRQLALARYPKYVGYDPSPAAVQTCVSRFAGDSTKTFRVLGAPDGETAQLALSLDVAYHLVEDDVFEAHLTRLFASATRLAVIYSTDRDVPHVPGSHERHRRVTRWISEHVPGWTLARHVPNIHPPGPDGVGGSLADFFVYAPGRDLRR